MEKIDVEEDIEDDDNAHVSRFVQSQGSNATMNSGKPKTQTQKSIRFQQPISQQSDAHMNSQSSHALSFRSVGSDI